MRVLVVDPGAPDVLVRRAVAWGERLGETSVVPADRAAAAVTGEGPLVVVWADTPRLGEIHAHGVRVDLDGGAEIVAGPTLDGSVYLLAMREPRRSLVGLPFHKVLEAAAEQQLETGMLRHERRLLRATDRRALLADPLLDADVRGALSA